jgi:hypothetical protein
MWSSRERRGIAGRVQNPPQKLARSEVAQIGPWAFSLRLGRRRGQRRSTDSRGRLSYIFSLMVKECTRLIAFNY